MWCRVWRIYFLQVLLAWRSSIWRWLGNWQAYVSGGNTIYYGLWSFFQERYWQPLNPVHIVQWPVALLSTASLTSNRLFLHTVVCYGVLLARLVEDDVARLALGVHIVFQLLTVGLVGFGIVVVVWWFYLRRWCFCVIMFGHGRGWWYYSLVGLPRDGGGSVLLSCLNMMNFYGVIVCWVCLDVPIFPCCYHAWTWWSLVILFCGGSTWTWSFCV